MSNNLQTKTIDVSDMFSILKGFPKQIKEAVEIGKKAPKFKEIPTPMNKFAVLGMGGSAIAGDVLRTYCASMPGADKLLISVFRNYDLPNYIDSSYSVLASSYSGETEETLSAFEQAKKKTSRVMTIASGGTITEKAKEAGFPTLMIPGGLQPRCALGYSFFAMLGALENNGVLSAENLKEIQIAKEETIKLIEEKAEIYSTIDEETNPAIKLAQKLCGHIPLFYSSNNLEAVNLRWRGQIQENSKNFAFGALLPEMNHNEIMQFSFPSELMKKFIIVFLNDKLDHKRVNLRFSALESILGGQTEDIIKLESGAQSFMARMFDLMYLSDWTAYYLAIFNKIDPTIIPAISELKTRLKATK